MKQTKFKYGDQVRVDNAITYLKGFFVDCVFTVVGFKSTMRRFPKGDIEEYQDEFRVIDPTHPMVEQSFLETELLAAE
jgi:hypothetical protein